MDDEIRYHVKGYWSKEGIFNGAVYKNNKKFCSCNRVLVPNDKIHCSPSIGKEIEFLRFKRWLSEHHLNRYDFLLEQIHLFMNQTPSKELVLI